MSTAASARWWAEIDPRRTPDGLPCAIGADLMPEVLLSAFQRGFFPMPTEHADQVEINQIVFADHAVLGSIQLLPTHHPLGPYATSWWNPAHRPVFGPGEVRMPSRLRRQLRNQLKWASTCNTAFDRVVAECAANRSREKEWLSADLAQTFHVLHEQGWAHSVEIWEGEELISGVFGLGFGSVFSMDSTFHRRSGASKVALADLQGRLAATGVRFLDAQMPGALAEGVGARMVDREVYLAALGEVDRPLRLDDEPHDAAWTATSGGNAGESTKT